MADHKQAAELAQQIAQKTEVSQTTSVTPAGQDEAAERDDGSLIEAINQVFALFRLNYHNQYYAAWSDAQQLGQVKRLWLEALSEFSGELILMGARRAIEGSDYLPTLNRMLASCSEALSELGCPRRPPPTRRLAWHPAQRLRQAGLIRSSTLRVRTRAGICWPTMPAARPGQYSKITTTAG